MTAGGICYLIRVAETLDPHWQGWFEELEIDPLNTGTLLRGTVTDQTALFGLLARIRDLNLTILEVRRMAENEQERPKT